MSTANSLPFSIKQGLQSALPQASLETVGTIFFCTDTGELYIDYLDADGITVQRRLVLQSELDNKMNRVNPVCTVSFSMGRKANTTVGTSSVATGYRVTASGDTSHAEGFCTTASGRDSHAEGYYTTANSKSQHVQGDYNILDIESPSARGTYAHIVGNGTSDDARSNAHTLDWNGNAWFAGNVYVGSTSGTNKDEGSKKLATEDYVNNATKPVAIKIARWTEV